MTILGSLLFILGLVLVLYSIVVALFGPSIEPGTPPWKALPGPFWPAPFWVGAYIAAVSILQLVLG